MWPQWHLLYGGIFSLLILLLPGVSKWAALVFFISTIFIDLDHYIIFIIKKKKFNPFEYLWWENDKRKRFKKFPLTKQNEFAKPHYFLHGLELLLVLFVLSFFWPLFFWIFLGFGLHHALDLINVIYLRHHPSFRLSQIWTWHSNKNKKKFD